MSAKRALMAFHHILSSHKIAALHEWSWQLRLCGIVKVGYPGILLCTGPASPLDEAGQKLGALDPVTEYVKRIKRLRWQTCTLKALGDVPAPETADSTKPTSAQDPLEALRTALSEYEDGPQSARGQRFKGLLQVDSMKEITAVLRAADQLAAVGRPGSGGSKHGWPKGAAMGCWETFYSEAMRGP
ncbi:hypothetical protein ACQY0O_004401 [Thecaphora frezii]